jgi:sucrose-6-phosphate hydrolase SacC (GH32 family)
MATVTIELAPHPVSPLSRPESSGHAPWLSLACGIAAAVVTTGCATTPETTSRAQVSPPDYYTEPYRPRFHFTPERNWMNDPNGMVYYEGEYHLFYQYNPFGDKWGHMSWGHAVSPDLVHWEHLPVALFEEDGVMIFSGSAVVDWKNSSGLGKDGRPPLVAIYTGHYTQQPLQNQHIAYSTDKGRTWTKYAGNPVLDIGSADFRDPKVFWHEPTARWVMVVAMAVDRTVRFYGSPNLKQWTLLSEFGPAAATAGIWECPDLFELPVEGGGGRTAWVLIVSIGSGSVAGGSGGQYFVGHFDGTRFTPDPAAMPKPVTEFVPAGQIIEDFEGEDYGDWMVTGDAFGPGPARGTLPGQNPVDGFKGRGLANSFHNGDITQGTLTSPSFEITDDYVNFLIGGGAHADQTCINLRVDGNVVRTATGDNSEHLVWKYWDVRALNGREAVIEIVDRHTGGWGHINVDHVYLADAPARSAAEPALWIDYGKDYYAAVSWSDVPKSDGRRLWIGWMSNWQYAQDVPTAPWRSAMSIPRTVALRETPEGLRLVQKPVGELQRLRQGHHRLRGGATVEHANQWLRREGIRGDQLELIVEWDASRVGVQGVKVLQGDEEETVIGVDNAQGRFFVDRTRSGDVTFHPQFSGVHEAPLRSRDGTVRLHIFVDACSIEVFANDGETVITDLVFPSQESRGIEFFGASVGTVDIWTLKSSWR